MKRTMLIFVGLSVLIVLLLNIPAKNQIIEANNELSVANSEQLAKLEVYRKETDAKIATNNDSIAAFNACIDSGKEDASVYHNKKISDLENRNTNLNKRLALINQMKESTRKNSSQNLIAIWMNWDKN